MVELRNMVFWTDIKVVLMGRMITSGCWIRILTGLLYNLSLEKPEGSDFITAILPYRIVYP